MQICVAPHPFCRRRLSIEIAEIGGKKNKSRDWRHKRLLHLSPDRPLPVGVAAFWQGVTS